MGDTLMLTIEARNVHSALAFGCRNIEAYGISDSSRFGDVIAIPYPVMTHYLHPTERVLFWPTRDANPFFHLIEGLWMLAGRNDLAWLERFNKNMKQFSDDGMIFHGAYGHRWMHHFGIWRDTSVPEIPASEFDSINQLQVVIDKLKKDPRDRRVVLTMWDPVVDLQHTGVDIPCNTHIYFRNHGGYLQMTVCCRSNDMIWGAYGANAVHFSMLQEYVAGMCGCDVGSMFQLSNNFHVYKDKWDEIDPNSIRLIEDPYKTGEVNVFPMIEDPTSWDLDLLLFFDSPLSNGFTNPFFSRVAKPMYAAHAAWKNTHDKDRYKKVFEILEQCEASDWRRAATEWMERRHARTIEKNS